MKEEMALGAVLTLAQAAKLVPGGPVAPQTVWRWIRTGVRSMDGQTVRLGCYKMGRKIGTTPVMLAEFFRAAGCRGDGAAYDAGGGNAFEQHPN